jgi:hypothetical protein
MGCCAQTYAVFTFAVVAGVEAFDTAYEQWLPDSGYQNGDGPESEFYSEAVDLQGASSAMQGTVLIRRPNGRSGQGGPRRANQEYAVDRGAHCGSGSGHRSVLCC